MHSAKMRENSKSAQKAHNWLEKVAAAAFA